MTAVAEAMNGGAFAQRSVDDHILTRIQSALSLVHSPHSANETRQDAQKFLENVKALDEAPSHGFALASNRAQTPIVRHYGLSLLEHAIRRRWAAYTAEQAQYLRQWILQLSEGVSRDDPAYLRSKIAQLWVDVAKRCWGSEWMDMDELLCRLWLVPDAPALKEFVLQVLEILSEDVFSNNNGEDPVVALREGELSKASVEIFTPAAVLVEVFPNRQPGPNVRFGKEGWLPRITELLGRCIEGDVQANEHLAECAIRSLAVLNSLMVWILPKAVIDAGCVRVICTALATPRLTVQKAALETLYALVSRSSFTDNEFLGLLVPMYENDFVHLCTRLLEWSAVDARDIDDDKYQFSKKLSETVSCLGNYLERKFAAIPKGLSVQGFLELALRVVKHQSLVVSIPVLVTWSRLLSHRSLGPVAADTPFIGPLLEICSLRMVRYESFPEESDDATFVLLLEDTDTIPERHAFLGNYRRYSSQVIECVVQLKLSEALSHVLRQAEEVFRAVHTAQQPLDVTGYSRNAMPTLRIDAQFTVVESALKGYVKWRTTKARSPEDVQASAALETEFETWCCNLLDAKVEDPVVRKRILQLLVVFSTTALDKRPSFMLRVLEHILMTWPALQPEHRALNDAIKDLQTESMVELQRLASKMPDHLLEVYDKLEAKVQAMVMSGALDEKRQLAYQSFLFIIIHRAASIDEPTRIRRLRLVVEPIKAQWNDNSLLQALSTYEGFCQLTALDKAQKYLAQRRVHEMSDWGAVALDADGLTLQAELEQRQAMLPLRSTKSFLTYSVEKIEKDSASYRASCELWQDGLAVILPLLLKFMSYAHASHNAQNWMALPPDMQSMVGRVLTDRFWQAGISEGSKDDFYARVLEKKGTIEGLASTVRGSVRFVRETCYAIIYCMSRLDHHFYGFRELPGPLANALFTDCVCLSSHQVINLLNLVRYLVDHCPVELRAHFLPPILAVCFQQMDAKIGAEWANLGAQVEVKAAAEELTEEMKAESILRQLTYTAVVMVADFLDPSRSDVSAEDAVDTNEAASSGKCPSLRKFCLMQASIVVPLLVFCKHAINMHDGRCCGVVLRIFRSIVPEFHKSQLAEDFTIPDDTATEIREYISSEVLQAAIQSLHDPYFVDSQKELGVVIASILAHYSATTQTPRSVLLSLPNMKAQEVDLAIELVSRPGIAPRQQRAIVLDLLKDLKGVSVSELGKLGKAIAAKPERATRRGARSKMTQDFMSTSNKADGEGDGAPAAVRKSPDLEGVAGMFGES